jgi:hypothetical protein
MANSRKKIVESSAGGHIDVAYGIYDRPGPDITNEPLPDFEPIVPREQVATQLTADRPPVDDPDFRPNSKKALELAMATLASYVPDEEIDKFYVLVRNKIEKMVDQGLLKDAGVGAGEEVMESKLRAKIKKMIVEAMEDEEQLPPEEIARMQKDFEEEFGPNDFEAMPMSTPDEMTLGDIAKETGFSGPSGVKNFLYRMLARVARLSDVRRSDLDALIEFAAGEYVDVLDQAKVLEEDELAMLRANKNHVMNLPSFKYFLGNAIVLPADETKVTLTNQLMGQMPRKLSLVDQRIDADVASGKMTAEEGERVKRKVTSSFEAMKDLATSGDDFIETALQRYSKMSKSKLAGIVKKAAEDPYVAEKV